MTTIVNPAGSPTIIYNLSGITVVSVTASGTSQATAAIIPNASGHTIANVTIPDSSNFCVILPSGSEIGDVVEVYAPTDTHEINVFPDSGSTILGLAMNAGVNPATAGMGFIFRKIGASSWGAVGS